MFSHKNAQRWVQWTFKFVYREDRTEHYTDHQPKPVPEVGDNTRQGARWRETGPTVARYQDGTNWWQTNTGFHFQNPRYKNLANSAGAVAVTNLILTGDPFLIFNHFNRSDTKTTFSSISFNEKEPTCLRPWHSSYITHFGSQLPNLQTIKIQKSNAITHIHRRWSLPPSAEHHVKASRREFDQWGLSQKFVKHVYYNNQVKFYLAL